MGHAIRSGKRAAVIGLCISIAAVFALFAWISIASGSTKLEWSLAVTGCCLIMPLLLSCIINWRNLDGGSEIYADN